MSACSANPSKHCPQCPFARSTPKEYLDTRGQNGERFAGQAVGPFMLPCHMHKAFDQWRENPIGPGAASPCVGAAVYRSNCGYTHLPDAIPLYPEDREAIFASPAELLAHHKGTTVEEEERFLREEKSIAAMCVDELQRQAVQFISIPRK